MITLQRFLDVMEAKLGNLTRTAEALRITKGHALRLARKWGLGAHAADLRQRAGNGAHGRPPSR